jgi:hypothetical protein
LSTKEPESLSCRSLGKRQKEKKMTANNLLKLLKNINVPLISAKSQREKEAPTHHHILSAKSSSPARCKPSSKITLLKDPKSNRIKNLRKFILL